MEKKRFAGDMTEGPVAGNVILYAIPLLLSDLLQQLYSTFDSWIVSNVVGDTALAAVGATYPVTNILVGFFLGLSAGATALVARYFGAKDDDNLRKAVHTSIVLMLFCSVLFTIIGLAITPWMLRMMNTPDEVFGSAVLYLRICFAGVTGTIVYNMCAGILRAVGNSKYPLYLLCVAAAVNVVLDILLVKVIPWGVAGAALATIFSQLVSGFLLLVTLFRTKKNYRVELKHLHLSPSHMKAILWIGVPAGIQRTITQFSNLFVLSYINAFGTSSMAAWSIYNRIHQFVLMPMQSLALAATAFSGQNYGAAKYRRVIYGTRVILVIACGITALFGFLSVAFCIPLCQLFNAHGEVLEYATIFVRVQMSLCIISCAGQVYAGSLRGIGDSKMPTALTLLTMVVLRQLYLAIFSRLFDSVYVAVFAFPVGWLLCSIACGIYFSWKKRRLLAESVQNA